MKKQYWYNLRKDMNLNVPKQIDNNIDLKRIHPKSIIKDFNNSFIEIPEEVQNQYSKFRPSKLRQAKDLENVIGTNCHIYYKYEGNNAIGSHKLNAAFPQVYYCYKENFNEVCTSTGAGQWGCAVAYACNIYGLKCSIFMTGSSYDNNPTRVKLMKILGAKVYRSPISNNDENIKNGSMAMASSDAIKYAINKSSSNYKVAEIFGSIIYQSIIGIEAKKELTNMKVSIDTICACAGGGSNLGGLSSIFIKDKINGNSDIEILAAEPIENPTITKGKYIYDYGDYDKITNKMKMYTIGSNYIMNDIYASGLRYHGLDETLSFLCNKGLIKGVSFEQKEIMNNAKLFYMSEGILPAPESAYAITAAIKKAKENDKSNILICLSGNGSMDIDSYYNFFVNVKE